MSILIKDNQTGHIHEYGTNCHDALHISSDGSCLYYENMQNGDGSMCGGYSFVMEDGKTPEDSETADAMRAMCYFNIGGFENHDTAELKQAIEELRKIYNFAIRNNHIQNPLNYSLNATYHNFKKNKNSEKRRN